MSFEGPLRFLLGAINHNSIFFLGKYFKTLFDIAELLNISLENDLNILVY